MFIKLKLYPVNIFPLFSYKYIFFIEQVQYVHIFRIVISHSLSESRIQILPCNCICNCIIISGGVVRENGTVDGERCCYRSIWFTIDTQERGVQRDVIEMILFYSKNYSNKNLTIISKQLCKYLIISSNNNYLL